MQKPYKILNLKQFKIFYLYNLIILQKFYENNWTLKILGRLKKHETLRIFLKYALTAKVTRIRLTDNPILKL